MQRLPAANPKDEKEKIQTKADSHSSVGKSKNASVAAKSLVFAGSTSARDALVAVGNAAAAGRYGNCSVSQLVLKLYGNKLPPAGATVSGEGCHFQILATNGHSITTIRVTGPQQ